ncbi:MAG: endonuclease/exonuclease/phosphatase family protein [Flavobacteriales bacterium]
MKKRHFLLRWANRVVFLITLLVGLGSLVSSNWLPGASLLSLIFPLLIIPNAILLLLSLRYMARKSPITIIGIGLTAIPVLAQLPLASAPEEDLEDIKIATYNVRGFYQEASVSEQIAKWTSEQNIDILCMQEIRKSVVSPIAERFPFRTHAPKWSGYSVGIYSTYAIINSGSLEFDRVEKQSYARFSAGFADIILPFDTVRVLNVHLSSTGVQDGDMTVEPTREDLLEASQFMARKIADSDENRGLQAEHIVEWVEESPHPVILCGDFNGVPGGNLYARLLVELKDPYILKGYGPMGTFEPLLRRHLPIRIDWTLHSEELVATGQYVDHIYLSDHFPLVTTISGLRQVGPLLE